jgi:hypothetical protein
MQYTILLFSYHKKNISTDIWFFKLKVQFDYEISRQTKVPTAAHRLGILDETNVVAEWLTLVLRMREVYPD